MATSGRQRILDRIRQAPVHDKPSLRTEVSLEQIFGTTRDLMERFLAECAANRTEVIVTADRAASAEALHALLETVPAGLIYVQDAPMLREKEAVFRGREVMWSSEGAAPELSQATLTLCDGLIAQTGSIVTSSRCGGRCGSIVAPVHLVYATTDQLLPDVTTALRHIMRDGQNEVSFVGLISGSSRTADIEKTLVHGAHGPVKVAVVLERR